MKIKLVILITIFVILSSNLASSEIRVNEVKTDDEYEYYSYDKLTDLLENLLQLYPDIFYYQSIGKTFENRDIWLVKISDNVSIDEQEPEVLYTGGIHGIEKPGFEVVIFTINSLVENYSSVNVNTSFTNRVKNIVNNTELFFIPMVNPDGIEAETRKNRKPNDCIFGDTLFRGVDLNRNFGYKWEDFVNHPFKYTLGTILQVGTRANRMFPFFDGINGQGSYRGPYPFSENETIAIKNFVEDHNIVTGIDYHSYGKKISYPWAWTKEKPADEALFLSIAKNMSKINDYSYLQFSDWYFVNGFFCDWMYGEHNILHFIIELDPTDAYGPRIKNNFKPVNEICQTHLMVNLYLAERSHTLN